MVNTLQLENSLKKKLGEGNNVVIQENFKSKSEIFILTRNEFEELPYYKERYEKVELWVHYNRQIYNLKYSKHSRHYVENIWI